MTPRSLLFITLATSLAVSRPLSSTADAAETRKPNVILIITDDQGHGDLGFHGNPKIRTPNIDNLARQSTILDNFFVSPVCSPTRSALMTGRYTYRTGIVDTAYGRSMMHPEEVTLAEMLGAAGYGTGIFGKWHLGDNYPLRPMDQGFQESLVLKGGGIGQPSDPPGGDSYFDPLLLHNGKWEKQKGYCSDVYTDAAMKFIEQHRAKPFFVYLPFNCPHSPLQVPDSYLEPYKKMSLAPSEFPNTGYPMEGRVDQETTAKIYGMITNIDDNLGRLFGKLDELKLADDTIVIFITDNGPQQERYKSGMRGRKGTVYDGGIRVPCFIRWPGHFAAGKKIDRIAAHIDMAPTLLAACDVAKPSDLKMDGVNLFPLLKGEKVEWPDRTIYVQWHRGEVPEMGRACAARSQRWKIVQPLGSGFGEGPKDPKFQLFDMQADPSEKNDLAAQHPDIVAQMRAGYEAWFKDVASTRNFAPPRIHLGTKHENPVTLTRQDWRGPKSGWGPTDIGHWEVLVAEPGMYEITLTFPQPVTGTAHFNIGAASVDKPLAVDTKQFTFPATQFSAGPARLETWALRGETKTGALYVDVKRVN